MTENLILLDEKTIKDKMYYIREMYVMIDSDLAEIYGYTTKAFNQQVKNNINKFESDFMFQLTEYEYNSLRSKKLTLNGRGQYKKYHIGTSLNHLGNKTFGINLLEEVEVKRLLNNKINNIVNKKV